MKIHDIQIKDLILKTKEFVDNLKNSGINAEINFSDLKTLDVKKIGIWPLWIKCIVWGIVFAIGYNIANNLLIVPELEKIANQTKLLEESKANYIKNTNLVDNLQEFRKQLSSFKPKIEELSSIIPIVSKMPIVISFITSEADKYNLTVDSIRPGATNDTDNVGYQALSVKMAGDYYSFADFLLSVSSSKRLLTVHALSIELDSVPGSKKLIFEFEVRAYWQSKGVLNA